MSQDPRTARRRVEILNGLGLHLRPAEKLVTRALKFQAQIRVRLGDREVSAKSILDLATLAAECGSILEIEAEGPDAEQAVAELAELVAARFFEDDEGRSVERAS